MGNEDVVESDEFNKFEEDRIKNIRESFAKGKIKKNKTKELTLCHKLKFVIPIALQPACVNLWYFKITLFDSIEFIV